MPRPPTIAVLMTGLMALSCVQEREYRPPPIDPGMPDPALVMATQIQAESTQVATVTRVQWRTEIPTTGFVEFGVPGEATHQTHTSGPTTEHQVLLLGMPGNTHVDFTIHSSSGQVRVTSPNRTITTGGTPSTVPSFTQVGDPGSWCCYQALAFQGQGQGVVVVDTQGRAVWYAIEEQPYAVMRTRLNADKTAFLYNAEGMSEETGDGMDPEDSALVRVGLAGASTQIEPWPFLQHDFTLLEDGTIVAIVGARDPSDPAGVLGDKIIERAPDGRETEVFNAWDWWPELADEDRLGHINALHYEPDEDAYYLSDYYLGFVLRLDRSTGEPSWLLAGPNTDFAFSDEDSQIEATHQIDRTDRGILVFDNGHYPTRPTRVVEYALDTEAWTASADWVITREPELYSPVLGDVAELDETQIRVTWGLAGEIQHIGRDGTVNWQLNTDLGHALAYGEVFEDFYRR